MAKATRTKTSSSKPKEAEPEAQGPEDGTPEKASSKPTSIADTLASVHAIPLFGSRKEAKQLSRKDADALIETLDLVTKALIDSIDRGKATAKAIKQNTKPGDKESKALIDAIQSHIDSDEETLEAVGDVKKSVNERIGKSTDEGALESIANSKPEDAITPEHRAQAILAHAATLQIEKSQHPRAVIVERSLKLGQLVPMEKGKGRLDIQGRVALPERILPGIAYTDKKGQRLSRTRRRNFKRIKLT